MIDQSEKHALKSVLDRMTVQGQLYDRLDDDRLRCYACGHECRIGEGKTGVCRVRFNADGKLRVPGGYVAGLACDPIEKKPFYHAFPGRDALSFGMLGCDLHCSYCQNWVTSQALRDPHAMAEIHPVTTEQILEYARRYRAPVICSTYNEPLITSEWAVANLMPAKDEGFIGAYVSNGNATERVLRYIRPYVQLYKVDLKTFDDRRYRELGGLLPHVRRSIGQLHAMGFWVEIVTLLVPTFNDSPDELKRMAAFLVDISPDMPWHITAFHSDYKMDGVRSTEATDLLTAGEIAREAGLRYIYLGNRPGQLGGWEDTHCPECGETVIERHGFMVTANHLDRGRCPRCRHAIPGFWDSDCVVLQENMGTPAWIEEHPEARVE